MQATCNASSGSPPVCANLCHKASFAPDPAQTRQSKPTEPKTPVFRAFPPFSGLFRPRANLLSFFYAAQWDASKSLEPWLARIAINQCRDHYRARLVRPELRWGDLTEGEQEAMQATLTAAEPKADALNDESRSLILRLLDTLSADDRMVLSLLHLDGKSTDEIAKLTGWSRTLVKVRAFRARRKLRAAFEQLEASHS